MVRVLYFGKLSDVSGCPQEELDLPAHVQDTATLREWLNARLDGQGELLEPTVRIALDGEIVVDPHTLEGTQEIALMPPVGGG